MKTITTTRSLHLVRVATELIPIPTTEAIREFFDPARHFLDEQVHDFAKIWVIGKAGVQRFYF
jgi:hypothetical protein